jgi:hypothetical protein
MRQAEIPESLQDRDQAKKQISELAVRLYRGQGGAGELVRLIGQQAELTGKRRAEAARKRAVIAA